MVRFVVILVAALAAAVTAGCEGREASSSGLPEADDWQAPQPIPSEVSSSTASGSAGGARNPHAGMGGGAGGNPHAGMGGMGGAGGNPHAGMGGMGGAGGNPHAGMDVSQSGFQPPDPDRAIDPDRFLRGSIRAAGAAADQVSRGDVLFLSAKPVNPATGEVIGAPVAVARLVIDELPVPFELTERNMMVAGTQFSGPVVIEARIDHDEEARTREPGDVEGSVQAKIPAEGLTLELDTVVQ